jgi:hypothetical protein
MINNKENKGNLSFLKIYEFNYFCCHVQKTTPTIIPNSGLIRWVKSPNSGLIRWVKSPNSGIIRWVKSPNSGIIRWVKSPKYAIIHVLWKEK